jgi:N-acyl-D-aspartate/D-glutamate deacylase
MHDLVIRGGTVLDGTGADPFDADIAVDEGRISAVGAVCGRGREEIDASDLVVTPGFVDPHTHYDGQATWDELVTPSVWHGVTTAIMGNCGVGFAPAAPDRHDWLISLMEGVEDIPGASLREAIRWDWESVGEYLDALDRVPHAIDLGVQVPHGAVRAYVMGERGADNEEATGDDLARMAAIVHEGVASGAIGLSTNRLPMHRALDGRPVPGTFASREELFALGRAAGTASPATVFSLILPTAMGHDPSSWPGELAWMAQLSRETGLAFTFGFGAATAVAGGWSGMAADVARANAEGARLRPMVGCRRQGLMLGLRTRHPFDTHPAHQELAGLPIAEQAARMADPEVRARILAPADDAGGLARWVLARAEATFPLTGAHDIEPSLDDSVAARARRLGTSVEEVVYDELVAHGGRRFLYCMLGDYDDGNLDTTAEMMDHPTTVLGLGDGGAHVSMICDAGYPTFLLGYWCRDRRRGTVPLPEAVRMLTSETAELFGLDDRGVVAPGRRADLNVIDPDRIALRYPDVAHDLPAGATRVVQRADGYAATLVAGEVIQRAGEDTGARPGCTVRRDPGR